VRRYPSSPAGVLSRQKPICFLTFKSENEAETASSSWLHGKEESHGMATSARGATAPEREKGGDDVSWANVNLTGLKNKENPHGQFNCFKWMVKN
jgi:hypothetical protein